MSAPDTTRRANRRRGEIEAVLGGERFILCLTLGALAELETAFGLDDLSALAEHLSSGRLSSRDVLTIIAAGLRGGGNPVEPEMLATMPVEGGMHAWIAILGDLLAATFGAEGKSASTNPPQAASLGSG